MPGPRIFNPANTAQSSSASGPAVSPTQTIFGSWVHVDDVVVATNHPEEAFNMLAVAAEHPDPQADPLGDAAVNIPDPEVDNLESGTEASVDTPRTTIHYSDVD